MENKEESLESQLPKFYTEEEVQAIKTELDDKYIRLLAEFDNYKKRITKEKEELKLNTKTQMLSSILDMDSDLAIAKKNIKEENEGLNLILTKFDTFLKNQGIETIQTETYDSDLHEVISILEIGEEKIIDVISKGYMIGEKPFRYPKIILGK
jgi:molecular chaperone GrpE